MICRPRVQRMPLPSYGMGLLFCHKAIDPRHVRHGQHQYSITFTKNVTQTSPHLLGSFPQGISPLLWCPIYQDDAEWPVLPNALFSLASSAYVAQTVCFPWFPEVLGTPPGGHQWGPKCEPTGLAFDGPPPKTRVGAACVPTGVAAQTKAHWVFRSSAWLTPTTQYPHWMFLACRSRHVWKHIAFYIY